MYDPHLLIDTTADSVKLWFQLLLSPSLEIPDLDNPEDSQLKASFLNPDLTIRLGHGRPPPDSTDPDVWLSSNIDLKPPGSILCAQLDRLHLTLEFHSSPKARRPKDKRVKTRAKVVDEPNATLLHDATIAHDNHLGSFEDVVGKLSRSLSGSIASCFERSHPSGSNQRPLSDLSTHPSQSFDMPRSPGEVTLAANDAPGGNLKVPTLDTPLDEDMLLSSDQDPSLLIASVQTDEEMLFSQDTESSPSILSQSTTTSTISTISTLSSASSLKRSFPFDSSITAQAEVPIRLDVSPACKLAETALRILIGGYAPRRTRLLGVRVDKPPPETSLSDLAPGLFSPSFKVVRLSHVQPTISKVNLHAVNVTQCSIPTHHFARVRLMAAKCPVADSKTQAFSAGILPIINFRLGGRRNKQLRGRYRSHYVCRTGETLGHDAEKAVRPNRSQISFQCTI